MSKTRMSVGAAGVLVISWAVMFGCKQGDEQAASSSPKAALPPEFFAAQEPAGAKTVEEVKKSAKAGDTVTIRGKVGGSLEPFVEGRAVFTLMGPGLKPCGHGSPMPDCKTPWDYCCDLPEDIAAHSATIQFVDEKGAPLRALVKGQRDVKELSEIVVVGQVKQVDKKLLLVNATKMFVAKP
jgi:hypothetical protein